MASKKTNAVIAGTLVVVLGVSMGVGAIIGATTKKDPSYVNFYINNKMYEVSSSTKDAKSLAKSGKLTNAQLADIAKRKFMTLALTGSTEINGTTDENYNYILNENNGQWNVPYLIEEMMSGSTNQDAVSQLEELFVQVEFFNKTLTDGVYGYLTGDSFSGDNVSEELNTVLDDWSIESNPTTGLAGGNFGDRTVSVTYADLLANKEYFNRIIDALRTSSTYQETVLQDMMTYAYLWQKSGSSKFDYNLTKEIYYLKPSSFSSISIGQGNKTSTENGDAFQALATRTDSKITADEWSTIFTADNWNNKADAGLANQNELNIFAPTENGFSGYKGIRFGTGGDANVKDDFVDTENTWVINSETGETQANILYNSEDVLHQGNLYLANKDNGQGAILGSSTDVSDPGMIVDGPISILDGGSAEVISYTQLVPYIFATAKDGSLTNYQYSLFANLNGDVYTKATAEAHDEYIFDRWFGTDAKAGEILLATEIIAHDSTLTDHANHYWRDKGFYIDLSGSYANDFTSLLPDVFLK